MAQGSKPRHSRSTRKPVTIDLEPEAVSEDGKDEKKTAAGSKAAATAKATTTSTPKTGASRASAAKAAETKGTDEKNDPAVAAEKVKAEAARAAEAMKGTTADTDQPKSETAEADKADTAAKTSETAGQAEPVSGPSQGTGETPSSGGGMRTVGAGLAGGVIAIALLAGLQWGGVLPTPGASDSQTGVLSADMEALKQTVAALESEAGSASTDVGQALQERIEALEKTADLSAGGAGSTLSALETKLSELAAKVESTGGSGTGGASEELSGKVAALETATTGHQSDLTKVQSSITDLVNRISADEQKQDETLKGLDDRLASIEKTLSSPREDIKVAQALAAANLKAAIDRGGSFMAELEAFASVDKDSPAIAQLNNFAASGVPSRATLLNEFPSAATDMINAATGSSNDTGWVDRLMNSASSLVQVRPVGEVSGDSVEAIVARMETKLNNGDLLGAVDEWKTLPEASQQASKAYADDLQARILVEKLVAGTVNAALPTETTASGSAQTQQAEPQQTEAQQTDTQQSDTQQSGGTN